MQRVSRSDSIGREVESAVVLRTSWVYADKGANFLRTIARLAGERSELRIVADQIGAPTTARVIARAVLARLIRQRAPERLASVV